MSPNSSNRAGLYDQGQPFLWFLNQGNQSTWLPEYLVTWVLGYLGTLLLKLLGYFATGRGSMASRHHLSCGYSYKLDAIRGLDLEPMVLIQTDAFFR